MLQAIYIDVDAADSNKLLMLVLLLLLLLTLIMLLLLIALILVLVMELLFLLLIMMYLSTCMANVVKYVASPFLTMNVPPMPTADEGKAANRVLRIADTKFSPLVLFLHLT